ncbi:MAG: hypothetical protein J7J52_03385, partial [Deltaproteobacteria bacterium]|nr:hypothetical protein [Deltaproteobacteria bacterium]
VFSYPWVARIFWIRPCRFRCNLSIDRHRLLFFATSFAKLDCKEGLKRVFLDGLCRNGCGLLPSGRT